MFQQFRWNGFVLVAFPSNDFNQEPLVGDALHDFYAGKGVTFPVFAPIHVNGDAQHRLYRWLKSQPAGAGTLTNDIKWNYTLFVVSRQGEVLARFAPSKAPQEAASKTIEKAL